MPKSVNPIPWEKICSLQQPGFTCMAEGYVLGSWGYAKGLAVLCLKANCKYKASSTCFCCSSHGAFPCNATTVSSWDTVTVWVAWELQAPKDTRCPCGMPGLRRQRGWSRVQQHCWSRVLPICCPQYHPWQPQPCLLPKIRSWLSCDCSSVTALARAA